MTADARAIRADEIREHLSVIGEPRTDDERAMVAFLRRELAEIQGGSKC